MVDLTALRSAVRVKITALELPAYNVARVQLSDIKQIAGAPGLVVIYRTNAAFSAAMRQARGYQYPMALFSHFEALCHGLYDLLEEKTACLFPCEAAACALSGLDEIKRLGATVDERAGIINVPIVELGEVAKRAREDPETLRLNPWVGMLIQYLEPFRPTGPPWLRFIFAPEDSGVSDHVIKQAIRLSLGWNFNAQYIEPHIDEEVPNVRRLCTTAETVRRLPS